MKIKIKTGGGPDGSRATINFKDAINQNIFETEKITGILVKIKLVKNI